MDDDNDETSDSLGFYPVENAPAPQSAKEIYKFLSPINRNRGLAESPVTYTEFGCGSGKLGNR